MRRVPSTTLTLRANVLLLALLSLYGSAEVPPSPTNCNSEDGQCEGSAVNLLQYTLAVEDAESQVSASTDLDSKSLIMEKQEMHEQGKETLFGRVDTRVAAETLVNISADCSSDNQADCLGKYGCVWFTYDGECDSCSDAARSTIGCRDWPPAEYCGNIIGSKLSGNEDNVKHFGYVKGSGSDVYPFLHQKQCAHRCHAGGCETIPQEVGDLRGVNYGGRFLPEGELFSAPHFAALFEGVSIADLKKKDPHMEEEALCDLDVPDAGERMTTFLDKMIQESHFQDMAQSGFHIVRLPLGYWNLIDLPGDSTPSGPEYTDKGLPVTKRWRTLQRILPSSAYQTFIERVFEYAEHNGLLVLLDLHGMPGQQSGNKNTGCDLGGGSGPFFFNGKDEWNNKLGVQATERLAEICAAHSNCYGIELINEPFAPWIGPGAKRSDLQSFYLQAISAARQSLDSSKPIVIYDWPKHLSWWAANNQFSYEKHGHIMFASHLYAYPNPWTADLNSAVASFAEDMQAVKDFQNNAPFPLMVTEYGLNSHGKADGNDQFDYEGLTEWFVNKFRQYGIGSFVWNYDAVDHWGNAWGPVKAADWVGTSKVDWKRVFGGPVGKSSKRVDVFVRRL